MLERASGAGARDSQRRAERQPGIWRGPLAGMAQGELGHGGLRGHSFPGWRLLSAFIALLLVAVLVVFFNADAFYVRSLSVEGQRYLTREEVFALADVAGRHIFFINAADVRANILRSSSVAEARVQPGWPPDMLRISLEERQPALAWEESGVTTWIDLQGRVMLQREQREDLLLVRALAGPAGLPAPNVALDEAIVNGALQLQGLLPQLRELSFHPDKGLGYTAAGGWQVWLGSGAGMADRMLVYEALVGDLSRRGIQPQEINVANPHSPYYTVAGSQ